MSGDGSASPDGAEDPSQLFLDMLAAERGAAANTLAAYRRDLDDYLGYLAEVGVDPEEAQADQVRAYIASLDMQGEDEEILSHQWMADVFEPVVRAVPLRKNARRRAPMPVAQRAFNPGLVQPPQAARTLPRRPPPT